MASPGSDKSYSSSASASAALARRHFRADFAALEQYSPIKPLEVLAQELGLAVADLVKLDANENLHGPLPAIAQAVARCDVLHIYPDPSQTALRADVARFLAAPGVGAQHVCAGTGSDELLDLVFRLFDPRAVVNLPPTFGMYPFLAKLSKAAVLTADRGPAPAFAVDLAAVRAAVARGASVVFAASPNNPTGGMLTHDEVRALCALDAVVVVDEAYAEFAEGRSAAALVPAHANLIVMRTFSKWAGLAGLRVGYSVAHEEITTALLAIKQPYNVNVAADFAARAALAHAPDVMRLQVRPMLAQRARMERELPALGWLTAVPSDSNFVLFEVRRPFVAAEVVAALRARGILVRYYPTGRLAGYLRVSCGRPHDTDRLVAALADIGCAQEAAHGAPLGVSVRALAAAAAAAGAGAPTGFKVDKAALENLISRRLFVVPSFEIHGGVSGLFDYGPPGCALKENLLALWRSHFVLEDSLLQIECTTLTPYPVLKASGHVDKFEDLMVLVGRARLDCARR